MKSSTQEISPIIGTAMAGGFYAGRIRLDDGQIYALIVSPKAAGEHQPTTWTGDVKNVPGAQSYCDGRANTLAMAEAGSKLAQWALDLSIGDADDWYLPSQDELEVIYRALKPTPRQNDCWARSGLNLSAVEPTLPYTPDYPVQTMAEAFKQGGAESFESNWYWTSTQHLASPGYAWSQYFSYGGQYGYSTGTKLRARAVRRLIL